MVDDLRLYIKHKKNRLCNTLLSNNNMVKMCAFEIWKYIQKIYKYQSDRVNLSIVVKYIQIFSGGIHYFNKTKSENGVLNCTKIYLLFS